MKHFPVLRTRRLGIQLKELSIGDSIALAGMPEHLEQAGVTAFLRYAVSDVLNGPKDPAGWTVQERALAVAHYLASVLEDGPDFSLSEVSKYSDYLDSAIDISLSSTAVEIGEVGGDVWSIQHLTGAMAESIERVFGEIEGITPKTHWLIGAMSAQLLRKSEELPEPSDGGHYDEWLVNRMRVLIGFPTGEFELLLFSYYAGLEKLHHLFAYGFADEGGIIILPREGGAGLPPARFPVRSAISTIAETMAGKHDRFGR